MSEQLNILVIEDCNADFLMVERHLKQNGLSACCRRVDTLDDLKGATDSESWDLVLADYSVPQLDFQENLNLLQSSLPDLPIIMVTGSLGEEKAVELLKLGVCDFILKDNLARLVPAIERSLRDTSEHKARVLAEQALQNSEVHFRSIFSKSPIAIGIGKATNGLVVDVNDAWLLMYGYERDEVIGQTATELNLYVNPDERIEVIRLLHESGQVVNREVQARRKSGENFNILYSAELIELKGEIFLQGMMTDITEQKRMEVAFLESEKALRDSDERFQLAMRGANDGLWDLNLLTNETYFSPRWKSMLGYADEELENRYDIWEQRLHPEDLEPTLSRLHDYMERRTTTYEVEFRLRHKNGHYVDILSRAFLLDGDHGEALRIVGTHVDITERKKLEEQYRQAQKMEAIGQLAGGVAHDFNNILQAIFGYSFLILAKAKDNEQVKGYVEELIKASTRAADLTKGLLAFSRKQEVTLTVIDIGEVIKENEAFLRRLIREDIELKLSCSEESLAVLADRGQIEQIIMNLVTNGRDAMPNGGWLSIETQLAILDQAFIENHGYGTAGVYSSFSVSDSGFGMDKETQLHIFEPFFTTKEQGEGTGLGLSMVYGIVKKHGGFITVYSEPGFGSIFKVYLPLVQASVLAGKTEVMGEAPMRGGTETILVGEDDAALRRLSKNVLGHYGYHVIEAVDGQDAVDKFVEYGESIDLVILDAIMPKKNGKLACDEMRTMRPDLQVLFVSGYTRDIFSDGDAIDENFIFIQKPVLPDVLLAKVREMLDKKTTTGGGN
jgi:PAS domain S-box-containing protein